MGNTSFEVHPFDVMSVIECAWTISCGGVLKKPSQLILLWSGLVAGALKDQSVTTVMIGFAELFTSRTEPGGILSCNRTKDAGSADWCAASTGINWMGAENLLLIIVVMVVCAEAGILNHNRQTVRTSSE
jgi:hypothetical protein